MRVRLRGEPQIDWAMVDAAFTDPFFEQTAERAMQHPFNLAFRRTTPLAALDPFADDPPLAPTGFVFHMSRCGSTLIAQMLARLDATIVLSEPQPLDALLRLRGRGIDDETLIEWLRRMISALGRPRAGERRLFVKFHAWHVLELPLLARAFPNVPWVFVFREPRAVLRSQARGPGAEVIFGTIDPRLMDIDAAAGYALTPGEYAARVVAAFCDSALRCAALGRSAFLDYASLPDGLFDPLLAFFGLSPVEEETRRMREIARADTKHAGAAFSARGVTRDPAGEIDRLAAELLDPSYEALVRRAAGER